MIKGQTIGHDLVKGAIAGAFATWVMGKVTTWMYEFESDEAKRRENEARGDRTAYEVAVEEAAHAGGVALTDEQRSRGGSGLHWATGIGAGALYAVARRRWPSVAAGRGLPFGTVFFATIDEALIPQLGLTPGPTAFPWQTHVRGLGGHLVFGLATELALEGLEKIA
jgi:hypothetical protein